MARSVDIILDMKTISLSVPDSDYEAFHRAARERNRSAAQLIREAMAYFRIYKLEQRKPLTDLPVLNGHRPRGPLPVRAELYEEIFDDDSESSR